jgi:quercetin dioxygenase-like cupin family protein
VQKYNIHTAKKKNINSNYFTGKIDLREILSEENSLELEMYHVTFYSGALTSLHYHESDQILIATKGEGVVGLVEGSSISKSVVDINSITFLNEGDTVLIPANNMHFHGALNGQDFSHIAIMKMYKENKVTKWEYDLLSQEIHNGKETSEKEIMTAQEEIQAKIQMAISKKLKM